MSSMHVEYVPNCPLCFQAGSPLYKGLYDRLYRVQGRWNFFYCRSCQLAWLNPRPTAEDLIQCYPQEYFTHHETIHLNDYLSRLSDVSSWKRRLRTAILREYFGYRHLPAQSKVISWLARVMVTLPSVRKKVTMGLGAMLPPYVSGGKVLDLGCGNGTYLAIMKYLGWEVAGVEIDPKAAEITKCQGIPMYVGDLRTAPSPPGYFDLVTMSHVIEHVPDPIQFIRTAIHFLKPGGRLVIVTPNLLSLGSKIFKEDWYCLHPLRVDGKHREPFSSVG